MAEEVNYWRSRAEKAEDALAQVHRFLKRDSDRLSIAYHEADRRHEKLASCSTACGVEDERAAFVDRERRGYALHQVNCLLGILNTLMRACGVKEKDV